MAVQLLTRRWKWLGLTAATVCAGAALWALAWPAAVASTDDAFCGMGSAPDTADFKTSEQRQAAQLARDGFVRVCEANLRRYAPPSALKALPQAASGLAFCPLALGGTEFAQFSSLGGQVESISAIKSAFYRVFRTADGHTVTLFEHDMSADSSQSFRAAADEPERINGLPARLVVWEAASGKAVSVLSWLEGRRWIELWIDANMARGQARARFFAMAAALPKSVPANAHEADLQPLAFGPDGRPQLPPMPVTLSQAQMTAFLERATPARLPPVDCTGNGSASVPTPTR